MADDKNGKKKRKNDELEKPSKKRHTEVPKTLVTSVQTPTAGKIHRIFVRNFMCHEAFEIILNPNVNFIIGRNGSGKSALLTALTVGLGARAGITQRGKSVKEFIKKGKNSATVEVSLINEGPSSYKPNEYGKMITVVRQIGTTSSYKLKNSQGKTISTKKDELENIINAMNIQVENPISVLNQDVSRAFLVMANAAQKYQLFMKATQMDIISNNYKEAQMASEEVRQRLRNVDKNLAESKREVEAIEKKLEMLESVTSHREQIRLQDMELCWANAIAEEKKLRIILRNLEDQKKVLGDIESVESMRESREGELVSMIEANKNKIIEIEEQSADNVRSFHVLEERYMTEKEAFSTKSNKLKSVQLSIKRTENDIELICQEMKRIENNRVTEEKKLLKQQYSKLKEDLDEVEAMLRTKKTDRMHLQSNKERLQQEDHVANIEIQNCQNRIRKSKQQLASLKQQSDASVRVFGNEIPRLLKRINEEYEKGRFHKKPVGPLGAHIKLKDASWTPAVEAYLGAGLLGAFVADNAADSKMLRAIIKEIYMNSRGPIIITSRFLPKVHDISRWGVRDENHITLLDVMEISETVVTNCLIDQKQPECTMLIPTSREASEILSDYRRVPKNCKRALTKQGDEFFPAPNYRSYGGKVHRPKFLQISTREAIQVEEEELHVAEKDHEAAVKRQRVIADKLQRARAELGEVTQQLNKLQSIQDASTTKINSLSMQLAIDEVDSTTVFLTEKGVLEEKLAEQKTQEKELVAECEQLRKELKNLRDEVKRYQELKYSVDEEINKIKKKIRELEDEQEMIKMNSQHAKLKLEKARQSVQQLQADLDVQQRVTDKFVTDAENQCPRMETVRSIAEIKRISNELRVKIKAIESEVGSKELLEKELVEKRQKFKDIEDWANSIKECNDRQLVRVRERRALYKAIKNKIGQKVQTAFASILKLRQYKGSLKINHLEKILELNVTPHNVIRTGTTDARTLSGGERSYSTVAFILALWECTDLPFYFLDEFDVFMDKINRRIILDILLDHTRSHPGKQFTFLTPLDTSIVQIDDYLTIHQLAPPEREGNSQR